jgi:hypothetical protein
MDGELGDLDAGASSDEEDASAMAMGGTVEVGGNTWVRVATMGEDPRGDRPKTVMTMRNLVVNSHTTRSDFFKELFPVHPTDVLKVVQDNATRHRENDEGQTFYKEVKRPKVLEHHYDGCGGIDLHNNYR